MLEVLAMNSAIRARSASRRKNQLLGGLLNGEVGGKVTKRALSLGCRDSKLLLGCLHDAGSLFFNRRLDADLVVLALLLYFGVKLLDLVIEASQFGFNRAEPCIGLLGGRARFFQGRAQRFRTLVKDLGHDAKDGNADEQKDDGKIGELEDARGSFGGDVEGARGPLYDGAIEPEGVVLLFLRLGGRGTGVICGGRLRCCALCRVRIRRRLLERLRHESAKATSAASQSSDARPKNPAGRSLKIYGD